MDWAAAVLAALVSAAVALSYLSWKSHGFVETIIAHRAHSDKAATSRPDVLLVIAHPDDESMFFVPILLRLRPHVHWHVLCLSSGTLILRDACDSCNMQATTMGSARPAPRNSRLAGTSSEWMRPRSLSSMTLGSRYYDPG